MKTSVFTITFFVFFVRCSFATEADSIQFKTVSEGFLLDGVILKKTDRKENIPAVVFLVGSGGNSSHRTNYKDFAQFFLENKLLENGFAIVYFDKRGNGKSQGVWYKTTFEQRALDAKNVAIEIQKFSFIDKNKVFLIGHSQGGWIVQIALAQYPEVFAGGVSMAGATFGVKRQLINDYQSEFFCKKGLDEKKALKKATRRANRNFFFVSLLGRKGNWKQLKLIKNFEPGPYLEKINKPVLFLFGENDELVNLTWCIEELKALFPDGLPSNFDLEVAKGETHSFKIASKCYHGETAHTHYSETTNQKLFEWINIQASAN